MDTDATLAPLRVGGAPATTLEPEPAVVTPRLRSESLPEVTRADWLRALRYCVAVYLAVRVMLFALALLCTSIIPNSFPVGVPRWPAVGPSKLWHHAFTAWERWDALWYLSIASDGYRTDDASAAFFPLYPLLTRGLAEVLGGRILLSAYVVVNVALVIGLVLLYRLTALEFSDRVARTTVLCLCVFPTAFYLFSPFTESLFLALSVGSLYAARRHSWLLAGYLGALAATSRSTGLLLAAPLAVEALLQLRASGGPLRSRLLRFAGGLAASAAVGLGVLVYLAYWYQRGEWDRPLGLQATFWRKVQAMPWETLQAGWQQGTAGLAVFDRSYRTLDLFLVLLMLALGAAVTFRIRPTYAVYFWVSVLFPLTLMDPDRPLQSVPRYYLVVFPIMWSLALLCERFRVKDLVVPVLATGLGVMSLLFVTWNQIF